MALIPIFLQVVAVVLVLVVCVSAVVLERSHLARLRRELRQRLRIGLPGLLVLGTVLVLNMLLRALFEELSWLIGNNITGQIYRIEGEIVYELQSALGPAMTEFFSFVYIYGYILVLVFPIVAYLTLERLDAFQELTFAYTANYAIGLICYVIFIAYGPRNLIPELVGAPMYAEYPQFKLLTSEFNRDTNVFPSLHTSLSTTVLIFAWRTRKSLPLWVPIAAFLVPSIIVSTMYLGIHWFIDVIAGVGLGVLSAWLGIKAHESDYVRKLGTSIEGRLRELADRV